MKGEHENQESVGLRESGSFTQEDETEPRQTGGTEPSNLPVDRGWAWMILFGEFVNKIYLILCGYIEH